MKGSLHMSNNPLEDFLRGVQGQAQGGGNPFGGQQQGQGQSQGPRQGSGIPGMPGFDVDINFDAFKKRSKKFKVFVIILAIIIIAFCYWWFHPPINIHSQELWWFIVIFICLPAFVIFRSLRAKAEADAQYDVDAQPKAKRYKTLGYIPIAIVVIFAIGSFASATFFPFNAHRYATVLETTEYDFASDIEEVDYTQIPVIDRDSAAILGNRAMGTIPDYVSQFEISPLYSQINYQDKPVRVSPLGYADLFKWLTNRDPGIPAYVLVDMTTQNTQIVRLNEAMKYTQAEPLVRNIDRYVQLKYPFYMFEQLAFEIDDNGHPWWICPVQKRTIGLFGGETIQRVVLVDASTGETQDMTIEDVPEWVDRAYPSDLLIKQYNWWGRYCNGWWNSWIGQEGVRQTTPGTNGQLGYNYIAKDDDVWVYSGVTSATADNSIVGFVLINQRTADSHYYAVAGATEDSAMASAEGQVQQMRYVSTFPLLINIGGQPTYFMALKDQAGLVKQFAMIDIMRYQNVAIGDTVSQCQASYEQLLATNGVTIHTSQPAIETTKLTGTVDAMAQAVINGNSHFYLSLTGDNRIFDCALPDLVQVVKVAPGDEVSIEFYENDTMCTVTSLTVGSGSDAKTAQLNSTDAAAAASDAAAAQATSAAGTSTPTSASADDPSAAAVATGGGSTEVTTEGAAV